MSQHKGVTQMSLWANVPICVRTLLESLNDGMVGSSCLSVAWKWPSSLFECVRALLIRSSAHTDGQSQLSWWHFCIRAEESPEVGSHPSSFTYTVLCVFLWRWLRSVHVYVDDTGNLGIDPSNYRAIADINTNTDTFSLKCLITEKFRKFTIIC